MNRAKVLPGSPYVKDSKKINGAKPLISGILSLFISITCFSQNVGISATGVSADISAGLDINFTDKGLLIPRVSLTSASDVVTITSPATSLLVYNTNPSMTGGSTGYWYWGGSSWINLLRGATSISAPINIITSDVTLDDTQHTIIINSGTPTITLPAAGPGNYGRIYNIVNRTGAAVAISSFFTYTTTAVLIAASSKIEVQSDGTNWYQID